jgi:sugar phosphate isomerase/epimerase
MAWTRREVLAAGAGGLLGLAAAADRPKTPPARMGVVIHSYAVRKFDGPLSFLEHCQALGAGGAQTRLGVLDESQAAKLRDLQKKHGLFLEGSITLPRDKVDVKRFTAEVETAKRCEAATCRTVLMNGRRYEVFKRAEEFRKFLEQSKQALALARPVVEKQKVRLAVENHKDLQAAELLEVIRKLDSPFVGVCIDTGNNIALLETPQKTVELLAPYAFTTHIKDMGVEEYTDGFRLAEVPLGTGFLDLAGLVAALRKARPEIRLNLEMITRDPLEIPCLKQGYWATLQNVSGQRLAALLALVRAKAGRKPLPRVSKLSREDRLKLEEDNVRASLRYAADRLRRTWGAERQAGRNVAHCRGHHPLVSSRPPEDTPWTNVSSGTTATR